MHYLAPSWTTSAEQPESEERAQMSSDPATAEAETAFENETILRAYPPRDESDSLFEQVAWLYVFCRERLFRDDTERITAALWPNEKPPGGTRMLELGCGPGFYSCALARRFSQLIVVGVDRSERQLAWARARAQKRGLTNCHFQRGTVLKLPAAEERFDVLVASRLFVVVPEREAALAEMHRVLRSGGRCFIAEPRHAFRASVPLLAMWLLARATHANNGYREPRQAITLRREEFKKVVASQPWRKCECWEDGRYQYALCEKA
jgi:arsenite methyltransferase